MTGQANSPLLTVGLTGGIAAGKSTVAQMFRELGAAVVDADELAREVTRPGRGVLERILEELGGEGQELLGPDGELDRAALGRRVFGDAVARRRLEALTHPAIAAAAHRRFAQLASEGHRVVLYEAALLVETGRYQEMDALVVVTAEREVRIDRLLTRNGLDRRQAELRLAAQLPQRDKAALADYLIDNSGPLEQTRARVQQVWVELERRAATQIMDGS